MRLLRAMLIPLLGIAVGVLALLALNPTQAMRSAQSDAADRARRSALAAATCIDEHVYSEQGAFTGMPLDESCARAAVTARAHEAQVIVRGGVVTVTVTAQVRMLGFEVPGLVVRGEASAHAEYLEAE